MNTLQSLRRDLVHAMRTLAKERAFTLVCVISLGIGMGAVVALATFGRTLTAPARGINTDGLVEVLVLPEGPLREKAGVWALERWSYPDYQALRDADVGMDITGWSLESSEFGEPTPDQKAPSRVADLVRVAQLPPYSSACRSRVDPVSTPRTMIPRRPSRASS